MQTTPEQTAAWAESQVYRSAAARADHRVYPRLATSRQLPPPAVPETALGSREGVAGDDSDFAEFDRPLPGLRSSLLMACRFGVAPEYRVIVGAVLALLLGLLAVAVLGQPGAVAWLRGFFS